MELEALRIDRSGASARHRRRRRRSSLGWLVLLVLVALGAWVFRKPLLGFVDRLRLPEVRVVRITRTSAVTAAAVTGTAANGYVVPRVRAALSADTPGRIVEMNVVEGTVLKKGDVVARLYSDEAAAALSAAEAELASARASVARAERDVEAGAADAKRAQADLDGARSGLEQAQAAAELARRNHERLVDLARRGFETQQRLDEAEVEVTRSAAAASGAGAEVEAAERAAEAAALRESALRAAVEEARSRLPVLEARRDQAQATLDKTYVRAPFDGVVVLKDAEVGEVVSPNSQGAQSRGSVATMVDLETLEVQVELPETSLEAVEIGAPATVFLDAYPAHPYSARVQRIWPTANRQKATVEVRVGFDAPDDKLRPEMGARVVFRPAQAQDEPQASGGPAPGSILIPAECLVRVDGSQGAFVLERDVAHFRALATGEEAAGRVLVERGLEEGERVIVAPPDSLAEGDRVIVKED